jgi:CDP-4-dehydro-6-deoxyglucose reductase
VPTITVLPTGTEIPCWEGETVLAALVRSGFLMKFGCRRGGCGVCTVRLVEGSMRDERPVAESALPLTDRSGGVWLACRAAPVGDVTVELRTDDKLRLVSPLLRDVARRERDARRALVS